MNYILLALKTLIIAVATIFALRIFAILLNRVPGLFVSLSAIAIGILIFAMFKGSFEAIKLRSRKAILITMIFFIVLFFVSGSIMLFLEN